MNRANLVLVFIISVIIIVAALNLRTKDTNLAAESTVSTVAGHETGAPSVIKSADGIVYHSRMIVVESLTLTKVVIGNAIDSVLALI